MILVCTSLCSRLENRYLTHFSKGSWHPPSAPLLPSAADGTPESAYFLAVNRNKRSITVDFKSSEGRALLHKLVAQSDVLVENFIPGKLSEMGLGWEDCRKINPRLIYASISGMLCLRTVPLLG